MKKILATFLAMVMLLSVFSIFAIAETTLDPNDDTDMEAFKAVADLVTSAKFDNPPSRLTEIVVNALHEKFGYEIAEEFWYDTEKGTVYTEQWSWESGVTPLTVFNGIAKLVTKDEVVSALVDKYIALSPSLVEKLLSDEEDDFVPYWADEPYFMPKSSWYDSFDNGYIIADFGGCWDYQSTYVDSDVTYTDEGGIYSFYYKMEDTEWDEVNEKEVPVEHYFAVRFKNKAGGAVLYKYEALNSIPTESSGKNNSSTGSQNSSSQVVSAQVKYDAPTGFVIAGDSAFAAGTTVTAKTVESGKVYDTVKKAMSGLAKSFVAFDITAYKDGAAVQPNGKVKVTFPVPSNLSLDNLKLFYVSEDGKSENIPLTIDKNAKTATAELSHFSAYVLANVKSSPKTGDTTDNTVWYMFCLIALMGMSVAFVTVKARKDN